MGDAFFNQEDIMSKELAKTYDPKGLEAVSIRNGWITDTSTQK